MSTDETINPMDVILLRDDIDTMKKSFKFLTEYEKNILNERFGLLDEKPKTLRECGTMFHRTCEAIRKTQIIALHKLNACIFMANFCDENPKRNYKKETFDNWEHVVLKNINKIDPIKVGNILCEELFNHKLDNAARTYSNNICIIHINNNLFVGQEHCTKKAKAIAYKNYIKHYRHLLKY